MMIFKYEEELLSFMKEKKKKVILVELIKSDSSDFDLEELHVRLVSERIAKLYKEERKYKSTVTEHGEVLLPDYRLAIDEVVTFGLKKGLFGIRKIVQEGIRF